MMSEYVKIDDRTGGTNKTYCLSIYQVTVRNESKFERTVCNFQFMKSPVELNNLLLKRLFYITWFD